MIRKKNTASSNPRGQEVQLPPMEFKPPFSDKQVQQGILISCRAIEQYPVAIMLLAQAISVRADQILLDCTAQVYRFGVASMVCGRTCPPWIVRLAMGS